MSFNEAHVADFDSQEAAPPEVLTLVSDGFENTIEEAAATVEKQRGRVAELYDRMSRHSTASSWVIASAVTVVGVSFSGDVVSQAFRDGVSAAFLYAVHTGETIVNNFANGWPRPM